MRSARWLVACAMAAATGACATGGTVERGRVLDRDGRVLAASVSAPDGQPNRVYPYGGLTSHAVGYVGRTTPAERERLSPDGRPWIGRSAVERAFDESLRAGRDVRLALSVPLQQAARDAMRPFAAGAVVALDPRTGEVLALYTKPEFDPNLMAGRLDAKTWARIVAGRGLKARLQHRAVQAYSPGSTLKLATALAALERGRLPREFVCSGHLEEGHRRYHCHKRDGHGPVDLTRALATSCGPYFFEIGRSMPLADLVETATDLGYGEPTGVAIGEHSGRVPDRAWYDRHLQAGWRPGLGMVQAAGMGSLAVTPLQQARAVAAIANGGKLWRVRLATHVGGEPVWPTLTRELRARPASLAAVRRGMEAATAKGGTASALADHPARVAGKTGTAPVVGGRDHGWFVGYAPADVPRIAITVFVEQGGSASKVAVPVADAVLRRWLELGMP